MDIELKYGSSSFLLDSKSFSKSYSLLRVDRQRDILKQNENDILCAALEEPIASPRLNEMLQPGMKVAIITSDITRPCPSARLLPLILDELGQAGVADGDVQVIFGLGTHRAHSEDEKKRLAGEEVYRRICCIDSDPADVVHLGYTQRGTPLNVFRPVVEADVRICLGGIEYHYFAGYSGGYKAVVPGVCNQETIRHNHGMMIEAGAAAGVLDGNPVRQDIDEGGAKIGADFILNVILDDHKRIVHAVAGHPIQAHRVGCELLDRSGKAFVERAADIIVVSAGGYPKDINLYQAQKALDNAAHVIREGGIILLLAECSEGMGNAVFREWMEDPGGADALLNRIRKNFVLGGHKAAAIAAILKKCEIYLVSNMPADEVRRYGFRPFENLDEALQAALQKQGQDCHTVIMPEGPSILPSLICE